MMMKMKMMTMTRRKMYFKSRTNQRSIKFMMMMMMMMKIHSQPSNTAIKLLSNKFFLLLAVISFAWPEAVGARLVNQESSSSLTSSNDKLSDWLMSEQSYDSSDLLKARKLDSSPQQRPDITDTFAAVAAAAAAADAATASSSSIATSSDLNIDDYRRSPCQLVQVVHVLHQAGCNAKAIDSFACVGSCISYVQVSSSKFWQRERSCSCCQQTGLKEATFTLDCPALDPPYRKVKTFAPVECLCRSCTDLVREKLQPQELIEAKLMNQQV